MDFSFPKQVEVMAQEVAEFAAALPEEIIQRDQECSFCRESWKSCADFGVLGFAVPKEYGGAGHDSLTTARLMEALGYGCRDSGLTFAINSQMSSVTPSILKFGTAEQCSTFLPRLVSGTCAAFAITEEDTGSDSFALQATAERKGDGYILNGVKKFITLGPEAELSLIFANSRPEAGKWGVSAFIVEREREGFSATKTQAKMGLRTCPIGNIALSDCFVPEANRLGSEGAGVSIFTTAMNSERGYVLATQVGAMQRQLEDCIEFAKNRQQFGKPIGKFQAISHRIADMRLRLELARLVLYKAAWSEAQDRSSVLEASLAKLYVSEACIESSMDAIRTHGARGYITEYGIERDLRDNVGGVIYSGTSDIQRNIIASLLGL